MNNKLNLIAKKAEQDKRIKFNALMHHFSAENLLGCHRELKRNKACGIDGVTMEEYEQNLQGNIELLVNDLKSKSYRPKPVRRVYIPKPGKGEKRGLGIPALEDKIVQLMLKKILESIFENDFLDCSFGFRPKLSCHAAIDCIDKTIMLKPINYVVEVDIRKFFDSINHEWLHKCIEERVSDPNVLWLIHRLLKAGYIEEGKYYSSTLGTPQGGVVSPLLANIYLHYVLDLWFEKKFKPKCYGYVKLVRYCDDFIVCCANGKDAENFLIELKARLSKFSLEVAQDKTNTIAFGRRAWTLWRQQGKTKPGTFTFLGFTHYCNKTRHGKFTVGRKTSKQSLRRAIADIHGWLKKTRSWLPLKEWWKTLRLKLNGHYQYFGVSGNMRWLRQFRDKVVQAAYKWINRRSQKRSMYRKGFQQYLEKYPLPMPKIYHSLNTLSLSGKCFIEEPCVGKLQARFCGGRHSNATI